MKCPKCNYENCKDALYCGLCYHVLRKEEIPLEVIHYEAEKDFDIIKLKDEPKTKIIKIDKPTTKSKNWIKYFILTIVVIFLIFISLPYIVEKVLSANLKAQTEKRIKNIKEANIKAAEKNMLAEKTRWENFIPYEGELNIKINPVESLFGTTKETLQNFRETKINNYSILNIFQSPYKLCGKIFSSIEFDKDWVHDTQFYICNPYLLIIMSQAQYINPLMIYCGNPEIKYYNKTIEETYKTNAAKQFFNIIYSNETNPGLVRLWMVNAFDAGLLYANVCKEKSENIDITYNSSKSNIINSVHSQSGIFHVGHYQKNNLSPYDESGLLKISEKNKNTTIYVKLWVVKPQDITQQEDFAYIIKIIP